MTMTEGIVEAAETRTVWRSGDYGPTTDREDLMDVTYMADEVMRVLRGKSAMNALVVAVPEEGDALEPFVALDFCRAWSAIGRALADQGLPAWDVSGTQIAPPKAIWDVGGRLFMDFEGGVGFAFLALTRQGEAALDALLPSHVGYDDRGVVRGVGLREVESILGDPSNVRDVRLLDDMSVEESPEALTRSQTAQYVELLAAHAPAAGELPPQEV